jgi:cytoskeletal protein CcmA (bactofilin family)
MKYLKILGLAAIAAAALMAFAGSASATVLCANNASTTACSSKYAAGTVIESSLSASATLETTGGTVLDTCTGGKVNGKVENAGSSTTTVSGKITSLTWEGCTKETKTLANGELEIHWISGTDNGTLTAKNTQVTVNGLFEGESCIYGAGAGTDLGTVVGGTNATLLISALVPRQTGSGFLCPAETRWTASYKVTAPNPLYVATA